MVTLPPEDTIVARADPLPPIRLAEPFEALRDAADQILTATGVRPKIFLADLGARDEFTARATFARNFFACGGIESLDSDSIASAADTIAAFKRSGTRLACLCGSDDAYAREGENAAKALRAAGASRIYLVGEPGTRSGQLRPAGVDAFIFAGCDALSILRAALGVDASIR